VHKGANLTLKTTAARGRINIHGAVSLENFDAPFVEPLTVDGNSAVQFLSRIKAKNPTKSAIYLIWNNAPFYAKQSENTALRSRIRFPITFLSSHTRIFGFWDNRGIKRKASFNIPVDQCRSTGPQSAALSLPSDKTKCEG
jgi:hypothetical protein